MEGSGTLGNSQGSSSTTASDSSAVEIKALFYFDCKPTFSASDGTLQIAEGGPPHLIRFGNDTSFRDFKKIINSLESQCSAVFRNDASFGDFKKIIKSLKSLPFTVFSFRYYLPGQGLIALSSEEDMKNMIEEFNELVRLQGPQMFKVFLN